MKMLKFVSHLRLVESYRVYTLSLPKKHYFPVLQPKRKKIALYFDSWRNSFNFLHVSITKPWNQDQIGIKNFIYQMLENFSYRKGIYVNRSY